MQKYKKEDMIFRLAWNVLAWNNKGRQVHILSGVSFITFRNDRYDSQRNT